MNNGITSIIKLGPDQCVYSLHTVLFRMQGGRRSSKSLTPKFAKQKTHSSVHPGGLHKGVLRAKEPKKSFTEVIRHVMCFIHFTE